MIYASECLRRELKNQCAEKGATGSEASLERLLHNLTCQNIKIHSLTNLKIMIFFPNVTFKKNKGGFRLQF